MKILGTIMIILTFVGIFLWAWKDHGIKIALMSFGWTVFLMAWIGIGVWLTQQ